MQRITVKNLDTGTERIYNDMKTARQLMNPYDRYVFIIDDVETSITWKEMLAAAIIGLATYALLNVIG